MSSLSAARPASPAYTDLTPEELARHCSQLRLVDVREPHEYRGELGHIAGAELVPLASLASVSRAWPKDEPLVVVCRSGGRSAQGARALAQLGFSAVHNLAGGMLRWNAERRAIAH